MDFVDSFYEHAIGLLVLKSHSIATKTGQWTYRDHDLLERMVKELETLRSAANRYSLRIQEYRTGIEDVLEEYSREYPEAWAKLLEERAKKVAS